MFLKYVISPIPLMKSPFSNTISELAVFLFLKSAALTFSLIYPLACSNVLIPARPQNILITLSAKL